MLVENFRYDSILGDLQLALCGIGCEGAHEGIKEYPDTQCISVSW
jgi:hypothetical protein